jgi:sugar phosphate isomerase/epimerase
MEFSLAHLTLIDCSPPELIEIAARAGYDFVGLRPMPVGYSGEPLYPLATDAGLLRRTRAALAATGLEVLDIELARIYTGVKPRDYLPALEAGAELGARHVVTSGWCGDWSFVVDCFAELCNLVRPLGLTVDFEFVTFNEFPTPQSVAEILRRAARDNGGLLVDTLHFDRSECDPEELARLPREWFHFAQICDAAANYSREDAELKRVAREGRLYFGEGGINVAAIAASMPAIPYSIELPNDRRLRELGAEEHARRCLSTARLCLNAVHGAAA